MTDLQMLEHLFVAIRDAGNWSPLRGSLMCAAERIGAATFRQICTAAKEPDAMRSVELLLSQGWLQHDSGKLRLGQKVTVSDKWYCERTKIMQHIREALK
jgi:DNA-binding IclR family transcriptional regulator